MQTHHLVGARLDFALLRAELGLPGEFAPTVVAEAERAAASPTLPDEDASDIEFVTVDPVGSRDLDQAVHIAREGDGYLVSYAIADVAAFVGPGSELDAETTRRGETVYFPDVRVPLHPPVLSEGAVSLLPGQLRPAVLWQIGLDARGEVLRTTVRRARVRSRTQLDYPGLQRDIDGGTAPGAVALLPEVGVLRAQAARRLHAIDLDMPSQEVESAPGGKWTLVLREQLPVERHNAQISLLTGMCAARLMLDAGYGILRTVPPPPPDAVTALRRVAAALAISWPPEAPPGDVLAGLDRTNPRHVVFLDHAVSLLRGSGYTVFDGAAPEQPLHAGVGAAYTHVTAPLRRLVDRYSSEICLAASARQPVPEWVRTALPGLPEAMAKADHRAHDADRAVVDATEAWLLSDRLGETFDAVVLDGGRTSSVVALDEPPVRARTSGENLTAGQRVRVRLVEADVTKRSVRFEVS